MNLAAFPLLTALAAGTGVSYPCLALSSHKLTPIPVSFFPLVQDHYDWGLRAIKSVLVVAGSLKHADPERPEEQVLMRSLRDFNIPKIVTDDMPVFMGLIGDLFPALDVPRKWDLDFEAVVKEAVLELWLQPEDNFVLKVRQGMFCSACTTRSSDRFSQPSLLLQRGLCTITES